LGLTVEIGDYQITGNINQWLGDIYMEMCDLEKAEKYLNEANSIFEKAQDVLAQLSDTAPALASLYTKKGETQKAGRLVTQIYEHAKESGSKVEMADAELYLGNLLREQKNFGEAIRHFDSGLKLYESLEAKKWYALRYTELLYGYGLAYLERNETGDPERAYVLFDRTLEMYKRIGASKRIEEIETRKKQLIN
jgi:tetratricopeptide (TPR) repeat protein